MPSRENSSRWGFSTNLTLSLLVAAIMWRSSSFATDQIHFQKLLSFGSSTNDGIHPISSLLLGSDGALYGVTLQGGTYGRDTDFNGWGTVFRLQTDGSGYEILHHFGSVPEDGQRPVGQLIEASDGMLYGTTLNGGGIRINDDSYGTVFRMSKDGSGYAVLHKLNGAPDGKWPAAQVIEASNGTLYGTTSDGGPPGYYGTAFGLNKDGSNFHVLHSFGPNPPSIDGSDPGPLLEASDGILYGTTIGNTLFKINKDGSGYSRLHDFDFESQIAVNPSAQLTEGSDGALYGILGGGYGGVFKLNKNGSNYRLLAIFIGADGPSSKLIKGRDGAFYATTVVGGFHVGSVYRINEDGTGFQDVYRFRPTSNDGRSPAGLILGPDRTFYGVAQSGGDYNGGTVYRLFVNRAPVVQSANRSVTADSRCAADVSIDNGSYDPEGDPITLLQIPPGPYPLGTNLVTLTVTDSLGASNTSVASVVVLDRTPPDIICPSNITVEFTSEEGAAVTFSANAVDSCDPNPRIISTPPPGGTFPIGVTRVQITALDASSNSALCSFAVTVLGARGVKQEVLTEMTALRDALGCGTASETNGNVCNKLNGAILNLANSLQDSFWIDETHIDRSNGKQLYQQEERAIQNLCAILNIRGADIPNSLVQGFINRITRADRLLASTAIEDALAAGASPRAIQQAEKLLARGDSDFATGGCGGGLEDFAEAWKLTAGSPPAQSGNGNANSAISTTPAAF